MMMLSWQVDVEIERKKKRKKTNAKIGA